MIVSFGGKTPQDRGAAFVAPNATVLGDVILEAGSSVWYGAVLRGDDGTLTLGENTNVQDNAVLHCDPGGAVSLGEGYSPSWLPDGSGVVYNLSVDDGHNLIASDLYLASVDGKEISNLTNSPEVIELNPSVSPGGGEVAYEVDGVVWVSQLF